MFYAGNHVLGGRLELTAPADTILAAWLARQQFADEFAERDTRWWLETIARPRGNIVAFWEQCRSSYMRAADRAKLIDELAASARSGSVLLVHSDSHHYVTAWTVANGTLTKQESKTPFPPEPAVAPADRRFFEAKEAEIKERYRTLGDGDHFRELIAMAPRRSCLVLEGGSSELRGEVFGYIAARVAKPARYVPDLLALSNEEQMALRGQLEEGGLFIAIAGADFTEAIQDGKLREDLYYRISGGQRWKVQDSDAALIRPPAPTA